MKTLICLLTRRGEGVLALLALTFALALASCANPGNGTESTDDSAKNDAFHADNDIAMTVRSVADALRVGEALDTTSYNFEGVLTDGQGRPLYSNLHGTPGKWIVDALNDSTLTIRNVDLGDLLPVDLEGYIVSSLGLTEQNLVDSLSVDIPSAHSINAYDFGGGVVRFEVHQVSTPADMEAAMVQISLSK